MLWRARDAAEAGDHPGASAAWLDYTRRTGTLQRELANEGARLWDDPPLRAKLHQLAADARRLGEEDPR